MYLDCFETELLAAGDFRPRVDVFYEYEQTVPISPNKYPGFIHFLNTLDICNVSNKGHPMNRWVFIGRNTTLRA